MGTEYREALIALAIIVILTATGFMLTQLGHSPQYIGLM
jgi:hypothetical protein